MKESQVAVMEEFVDNVKVLINTLGYKVLEPLIVVPTILESDFTVESNSEKILYLSRKIRKSGKVIEAKCKQTNEGFVVLKGSNIEAEDAKVIPKAIKERRLNANIDENHILQDDELFNSPSYAAAFVIGMNTNGLNDWKTKGGITLKELEE